MATSASDAILGEIVRLAKADLGFDEYSRAAARALRRAVPFDGVAAVVFDPATALPVDMWTDSEIVIDDVDVTAFRQLAASGRRATRMSEATGGIDAGRRSRGLGDELRGVWVSDAGVRSAFVLHRERGAPSFTTRDVDLIAALTSGCAEVQRVRLERDLVADADSGEPGLLVLDDEDRIEMSDPAAAAWLGELGGNGALPLVVTAVAHRAREIASGCTEGAATARARTPSGRWVLARGSVLANGGHPRTAITLEPARAPELAELIADAYRLTARERRVTRLVAQGLPTAAIAAQLYLSTYTVQDHLKAIFEKLGLSSRGELVARLFVDHSRGGGQHPIG